MPSTSHNISRPQERVDDLAMLNATIGQRTCASMTGIRMTRRERSVAGGSIDGPVSHLDPFPARDDRVQVGVVTDQEKRGVSTLFDPCETSGSELFGSMIDAPEAAAVKRILHRGVRQTLA